MTDFVGLANFQRALADPVFLGAISHNALIVVLSLVVQIPFALGHRPDAQPAVPGPRDPAPVFFAPYVIAEVITAIVWSLILQPNGLAERRARRRSASATLYQPWLADPTPSCSPCSSSSRGSTSGST